MRRFTLAALVWCVGCMSNTQAPVDTAAVRATIEATNAKLQGWYAAGAIDSVMTAYAADAIAMGPNAPAAVGADAIRAMWSGLVAAGTPHFTITTQSVVAADSIAVEHGRYTLQLRAKARADTTTLLLDDRGNYIVTWIHRDGRWLLLHDIATSEIPIPTPGSGK